MIIVLDSRRPSSLGVDANLRLEAYLGVYIVCLHTCSLLIRGVILAAVLTCC